MQIVRRLGSWRSKFLGTIMFSFFFHFRFRHTIRLIRGLRTCSKYKYAEFRAIRTLIRANTGLTHYTLVLKNWKFDSIFLIFHEKTLFFSNTKIQQCADSFAFQLFGSHTSGTVSNLLQKRYSEELRFL